MDIKTFANEIRGEILRVENMVKQLKQSTGTGDFQVAPGAPIADRGEMLANATLAYRHLEDGRMRLGKVIQAYEGGVSRYDKPAA